MRVGGVAERAVVRERVVAELGRVARVRPRAARRAAPRGGARAVRLAPAGAAPARAGPAAHAARVPPLPAGAPTLHSILYTDTGALNVPSLAQSDGTTSTRSTRGFQL